MLKHLIIYASFTTVGGICATTDGILKAILFSAPFSIVGFYVLFSLEEK